MHHESAESSLTELIADHEQEEHQAKVGDLGHLTPAKFRV